MVRLILLLICSFFTLSAFSQSLPDKVEPPFKVGEKLNYRVKYGFISCADAQLRIEQSNKGSNGNKTFHFVGDGKTVSAVRLIMRVQNRYDSHVDPLTLKPHLFTENIREGSYTRNSYARFDHGKKIVDSNKGKFAIQSNTLDVLSAFYYARSLDVSSMNPGDAFKLSYFIDDDVYPLEIKYLGKETIRTSFGHMECLKFTPSVIAGRIFREDSNMYLWITNDANRIPVKAKVEILIGSLTLNLTGYENLKYPLGTPFETAAVSSRSDN